MDDPGTDGDLSRTAAFLHDVFSADRFADARYLRWYYRENPVDHAVEVDRVEDGVQVGHFAGIPQDLHTSGRRLRGMILVDVSVSARARGRGLMASLHDECFEKGKQAGVDVVTGVANAPATPVYRKKLDYRIVRSLPARVCPPLWPTMERAQSHRVDASYRESRDFERLVQELDLAPTAGWSQRWTLELLRWRLASPAGTYTLHVGRRAVIVTCVVRERGIPVVSVLKTFRRGTGPVVNVNGLIAGACRYHRAPAAIYAGLSAKCVARGLPLPERLKPAPLNLILRATHPERLDVSQMEVDEIEFLDFDAF